MASITFHPTPPRVRHGRLPSTVVLAAALAGLVWLLAASPVDRAEQPAAQPSPLPLMATPTPTAGDTTVPDAATALRGRTFAFEDQPPTF